MTTLPTETGAAGVIPRLVDIGVSKTSEPEGLFKYAANNSETNTQYPTGEKTLV